MADKRIKDLMKNLESMGSDVKVSSGRNTAGGKTSICASSERLDFSSKLVSIESLACNHGMKIVRIDKTFLELTDY